VILILAFGVVAILVVTLFWPRAADEKFVVASAIEHSPEASSTKDPDVPTVAPVSQEQPIEASQGVMAGDDPLLVIYLTGAIVEPGVYELEQGSRLNDAIRLAGGLAEGSAANYVNLAVLLQDGQHVHVPFQEEIESGEAARIEAAGATGMAGASALAGDSIPGLAQAEQKVNINTADGAQLESLPGIGVATAQRIIDYRAKNGDFKSIEELKNVSGIGEKKYEGLADKVCI
jgi:competence protein ComEA